MRYGATPAHAETVAMTLTMAAPRVLAAAGASDVGRQRTVNEDRFHVDPARGIFMVIDGIGGHAAGDTAAEVALATVRERLERQTGSLPDRIREAITIANNEIHRLAATRLEWYGMACVLTVAVVDGDRAVVGHVGDSRLYRLRGDTIEKVTPDHSPIGEREDAQEISELEAMRHPRRNEVYRDVGSEQRTVTDEEFVYVAEVDLPPDSALLICSDGLTDQVPADRIRHLVRSAGTSPHAVVRALVDAANDAGGKDNVTVVFVQGERFLTDPTAAPAPKDGTPRRDAGARWRVVAALLGTLLLGLAVGFLWDRFDRTTGEITSVLSSSPITTVVIHPHQSLARAVSEAAPGTTILVEPGEYREQLHLRDRVRVISRVSRGATLRLPERAAERDTAVLAMNVTDAELAGFRIIGDAATPLGIGVFASDASLRLVDIEVTAAARAALELGRGLMLLAASDIHDNPGSALLLRTGASARLTHNIIARNATAEQSPTAFVIEHDARPEWLGNVFQDVAPASVGGATGAARTTLEQNNWFVNRRPPARAGGSRRPPAASR
jgi:serine/threonine protein phosphatase PrpC